MKTLTIFLLLLSGYTMAANAGETLAASAPQAKEHFNVTCPAKKLLPALDSAYHECSNGYGGGEHCENFVAIYRKLLPKYDCQSTNEAGIDFHVPALFMASGPGAVEDYTRLLWLLSSSQAKKDNKYRGEWFQKAVSEARILFGSREFQAILDGDLGETFGDRSRQIAKELRKAKNGTSTPQPSVKP
jgi:hypothetical protein